jgi:hypothetical protein
MNKRIIALIISSLILATAAVAQSVGVSPRRVVYRRPHPITPYKKSFTVTYPRVRAATPSLSRKIESAIDPIKVLDIKLKDELSDTQWLEEAGYEVEYNKHGILVASLSANGTAAYPDGFDRPVVVDLKTGNQAKPVDVFTDLAGLATKAKAKQQDEIKAAIVEIKKQDPETEDPASLFTDADFQVKDLDRFTVSDTGVTFDYDYGFPHVIQALQPEGRFSFTWAELKPFIKTEGLLGQFVK